MPRTNFGEFPIDLAKESNKNSDVVTYLSNYLPPPANTYKYQWYHGTLERAEAIKALLEYSQNLKKDNSISTEVETDKTKVREDFARNATTPPNIHSDNSGTFLLRFSSRSGYVLTMLCNDTPKNFRIQQTVR